MNTLPDAIAALADKRQILVFTGAGISTESGIPDFRGPNGVWTKVDPSRFTYQNWLRDAEMRREVWLGRVESPHHDAKPNTGHDAVARLWQAGRIIGVVTQNVDGLHADAGLPAAALVEVHGNTRWVKCLSCDDRTPMAEILDRVAAGDHDPHCPECGGLLKSATISFGEAMPERAMARSFAWAEACDAVVAVGSTLSVYPAANVPIAAARGGAPYVIINRGPTDHDHLADVRLEGGAGELLSALADQLG